MFFFSDIMQPSNTQIPLRRLAAFSVEPCRAKAADPAGHQATSRNGTPSAWQRGGIEPLLVALLVRLLLSSTPLRHRSPSLRPQEAMTAAMQAVNGQHNGGLFSPQDDKYYCAFTCPLARTEVLLLSPAFPSSSGSRRQKTWRKFCLRPEQNFRNSRSRVSSSRRSWSRSWTGRRRRSRTCR